MIQLCKVITRKAVISQKLEASNQQPQLTNDQTSKQKLSYSILKPEITLNF